MRRHAALAGRSVGLGLRKALYRLIRLPPRVLYETGLGRLLGRFVLLLVTTGRRTSARRITPLQYERVGADVVVGSARGARADWYQNVLAYPRVEVRLGRERFAGLAETSTDPGEIADFLRLRLRRHPRIVGSILRAAGLPRKPTQRELEDYAAGLALVRIRPIGRSGSGPGEASAGASAGAGDAPREGPRV